VDLFGPGGKAMGMVETDLDTPRRSYKATVPAGGAGVWSMKIGKASKGVLEDVRIYLKGDVAPFVSFTPDLVFKQRPGK